MFFFSLSRFHIHCHRRLPDLNLAPFLSFFSCRTGCHRFAPLLQLSVAGLFPLPLLQLPRVAAVVGRRGVAGLKSFPLPLLFHEEEENEREGGGKFFFFFLAFWSSFFSLLSLVFTLSLSACFLSFFLSFSWMSDRWSILGQTPIHWPSLGGSQIYSVKTMYPIFYKFLSSATIYNFYI